MPGRWPSLQTAIKDRVLYKFAAAQCSRGHKMSPYNMNILQSSEECHVTELSASGQWLCAEQTWDLTPILRWLRLRPRPDTSHQSSLLLHWQPADTPHTRRPLNAKKHVLPLPFEIFCFTYILGSFITDMAGWNVFTIKMRLNYA